jgi:hypothetical protein
MRSPFFRSTLFQLLVVGVISLLGPGLWVSLAAGRECAGEQRLIRIVMAQNANSSLGAGGALEPYLVRRSSLQHHEDRLQCAAYTCSRSDTRSMPATRSSSALWGCSASALPYLPTG